MKKNIAIIIPSLTVGGAERLAANLSVTLNDFGFNVFVILFDRSDDLAYGFSGELIDVSIAATANPIKKIMNMVRRIVALRKIKKEKKINIAISFGETANFINLLTCLGEKTIINVVTDIQANYNKVQGFFFRLIIKVLYKKANVIVAISEVIKHNLISVFKMPASIIKVIYCFINGSYLETLAKEKLDDQYRKIFDHPTVIMLGRLVEPKGQWHLIRAFSDVKKNVDNAKLIILSDGDLRAKLIGLAQNLGLRVYNVWQDQQLDDSYDVYFLGFQDNPFKFVANASLYAFSSVWEGFGISLVEAMACGVPVISTDCKAGPREILAPSTDVNYETKEVDRVEYGLLMPVFDRIWRDAAQQITDNELLWSKTIAELLKNTKLSVNYIEKGIIRANDFDSHNISNQWLKLLE